MLLAVPILLLVSASDPPGTLTAADVRNAEVCLPAIAQEGDRIVKLIDGKASTPEIPFAEMRAVAVGEIGGEPAAVAEIVWNTGGSGNWEIVARFAREGGKVVCRGVYSPDSDLPDGGTMVARIEIKDGRVYLYGADPLHHRTIDKPLVVPSQAFAACGGH
jgi:hypothetical protein